MKIFKHIMIVLGLLFMFFPVVFFQSNFILVNMVFDLPIIVLLNLFVLILMLQEEALQYKYVSIFLLTVAALAVFSSFFRMIPLPMGISLAYLLPIASGIMLGPVSGFLIGQLSMFVGGVFLGSLGPWTPYQSFVMGCVGFYAGVLFRPRRKPIFLVILYAVLANFSYGYWMSLTYWPVAVQNTTVSADWLERVKSYSGFYFSTSFFWDLTGAIGNALIFFIFFKTACQLLERASRRLTYNKIE